MAAESPKKQTQYKPNSNPIKPNFQKSLMNVSAVKTMNYEQITMNNANKNKPNSNPKRTQNKANFKLEANLSPRERRSLRVSFSESSNRGPIFLLPNPPRPANLARTNCPAGVLSTLSAVVISARHLHCPALNSCPRLFALCAPAPCPDNHKSFFHHHLASTG